VGNCGLRSFRGFLGRVAFRKFPNKHVKAGLIVPHILLMLYVHGWAVTILGYNTGLMCGSY
jgi:hypothetical protein